MFPLMHHYIGKNLAASNSSVIALAAVLPDLCVNMGLERAFGHTQGEAFYRWAQANCPAAKEVAFLFATHGVSPQGLDYYSDEYWPGEERGFCFQYANQYLPQVIKACAIPEKWAQWKGHNLVEMAFEADIVEKAPELCQEMMAAAEDTAAVNFVAEAFAAFAGIPPAKAAASLEKIPVIFGIDKGTPQELAEKYEIQLRIRHQITTASIPQIAALIQQIREEQQTAMADFTQKVFPLIAANLKALTEKYNPLSS
ncbi:MAG: hypothetical protein HFI72_02140 [Peptococcaceae bacterium]|nr:hypothetical protein [Peptococcaceae bacterium]